MIDLAALKVEITTDPATLSYTGDDRVDARLLNDQTARDLQDKVEPEVVLLALAKRDVGERCALDLLREAVEKETVAGVAVTDLAALSRARALWILLQFGSRVDTSDNKIMNSLVGLGILTNPQKNRIGKIKDSRAKELFGERVTSSDIAKARAS